MQNEAFEIQGQDRTAPWLVTCDHASNRVPNEIGGGSLGLPEPDMQRHIAYDVGAAGVSRHLAEALNCPAILSCFSRLVIDPNRGETDPTLVMRLYDGTIIPENREIDTREIERRKQAYYLPYHTALAELAAAESRPAIVAVHSFTPRLNSRAPRPWHVGILYDMRQPALSLALLAQLRAQPDLYVGENEPYAGHLPGDSIDRHAIGPGRHNTLIEIRSDLIETPQGQRAWAERLAPLLQNAYAAIT